MLKTMEAERETMTTQQRSRVLFVQYCAKSSGSTISGKLLVEGLMAEGWVVDVAFGFEGPYAAEYEQSGCRVYVVEHKSWLRGGGVVRFLVHLAKQRSARRCRVLHNYPLTFQYALDQ